jgi:allantoinase
MLQYSYRAGSLPTRNQRTDRDQSWVDYDPMLSRPKIIWPNGSGLAVWVCPCVLDYEFTPPHDRWLDPWARTAPPDVLGYSRQEYGNRAGFWRVLDVLDRYKVKPSAVVNVSALQRYPNITKAIAERGWDILGHGMCNTRFPYDFDQKTELAYYLEMLEVVEKLTGVRMKGMGGPGPQAGTEDTPDLLAEAGFVYHGDWFMDDQPFPLRVRKGRLIAMPYAVEMNDVSVLAAAEADEFCEIVCRQFDRLRDEGKQNGKVFCVSLHPPLIGQPQRIAALEKILDHITSFDDVWHATGAEIAEHYMTHYYEGAVHRLTERRGQTHV